MLGPTTNIKQAYQYGQDDEQNFVQNLALFYATFLKEHNTLVENKLELRPQLKDALNYLILISEVEDTEIFKICLEYWNTLASQLYREGAFQHGGLAVSSLNSYDSNSRKPFFAPILSRVSSYLLTKQICSISHLLCI